MKLTWLYEDRFLWKEDVKEPVQGRTQPNQLKTDPVLPDSTESDYPEPNNQRKCSKKRCRKITSKAEINEEREESFESMDDGYRWRKYGHKNIKNHQHPRSYYRCAYWDQECEARKHVQQTSDHPPIYKTTCFGRHTCENRLTDSGFGSDFGLPSNMIRFDKENRAEMEKRGDVSYRSLGEEYTPVRESWPSDGLPMVDPFDFHITEFDINGSWLL